jgi:PncC family amidohydrolase
MGAPSLEQQVGALLVSGHLTIAVAESCTGGLICHRLTNVSGSSDYFLGGIVSYSNQAKIDLLGVPAATIDKWGAVSEACVKAMAEGVRRVIKTDMGVAVSGIAGPTGGTKEKPVGTVHVALAGAHGLLHWKYRFEGERSAIKQKASDAALERILETLRPM